jgi:hypothetical protein
MLGLVSALVVVAAVTLAVIVTYYLRPSRGEHANPRGAATTVATLLAYEKPAPPPVPTPITRYGLPNGYDGISTAVIFDPELPGAPALVRPYLDNADYRRAALATLVTSEPAKRPSALIAAA